MLDICNLVDPAAPVEIEPGELYSVSGSVLFL